MNLYHSSALTPAQQIVARNAIKRLNKINHIFGKARHKLDDLVEACGSEAKAFDKLNEAAQAALKNGRLNLKNGINTETVVTVNGVDVVLVGGRVINGRFVLGSASRSRL
ncbi:hypothetical protein [Aliikangiella sp. IMCC44632]